MGLVVIRIQSSSSIGLGYGRPVDVNPRRGGMSIQFLVILLPVILGMMGFALDLGRLYLIRGELTQAASAVALAAADRLNGTIAAPELAANAAAATLNDSLLTANKYNFGSVIIGDTSNFLQSPEPTVSLFATAADAILASSIPSGNTADGTTARHVTVNITAEAPLLYWSLFALGQTRKTNIAATAVAGISAPLCTACAIMPLAVAALNIADNVDFGFVAGTRYTLGMQCNGGAQPALLTGTAARVPYLIIDRYDTGGTFSEDQQLFRDGAQGMVYSPNLSQCATVGTTENIWVTATAGACPAAVNSSVRDLLCGLGTRLDDVTSTLAGCATITDVATIATAYNQDTDQTDLDDYTLYVGTNKRVLTIPIVDALSTTVSTMVVQGFRQFLLEPTPNNASAFANNPSDVNGRFVALYLGTVMPVKQGSFGGTCGITSGPGKVVLHR